MGFLLAITGQEVLNKLDARIVWNSAIYKALIEVTYPPQELGAKYLMLKDSMWMYLPSLGQPLKIAAARRTKPPLE